MQDGAFWEPLNFGRFRRLQTARAKLFAGAENYALYAYIYNASS